MNRDEYEEYSDEYSDDGYDPRDYDGGLDAEDMYQELKEGDEQGDYDVEYADDEEGNEGGLLVGGRVRRKPPCSKGYIQGHRGLVEYCRLPYGERKALRSGKPKREPSHWQLFIKGRLKKLLDNGASFSDAMKELSNQYHSQGEDYEDDKRPRRLINTVRNKGKGLYGGARPKSKGLRKCQDYGETEIKNGKHKGQIVRRCALYNNHGPKYRVKKPNQGLRHCDSDNFKLGPSGRSRCAKFNPGPKLHS